MLRVNRLTIAQRMLSLVLFINLLASVAYAQESSSVRKGNYEIFYSAFNTSFLQPETAVAVGVKRAKDIGLINLSIREHLPDGTTQARKAKIISGTTFNLLHKNTLQWQEVVEPGAVYYLAKFKINNDNEMIVIKAAVTPEGEKNAIDIEFKNNFYRN